MHGGLVDDAVRAGGQHADLHVRCRIMGVVDDDLVLEFFVEGVPQFFLQFADGGGAVEPGGHQQLDVDGRIALAQGLDHHRQDVPAGYGPGMVGDDDHAVGFAFGQFAEPGGVDGVLHGLADDVQAVAGALELADAAGEHRGSVRHRQVHGGAAIEEFHGFHEWVPSFMSIYSILETFVLFYHRWEGVTNGGRGMELL